MKICIPIMATSLEESIIEARKTTEMKCDMLEWRMDCIEGKIRRDSFINAWNEIRMAAGNRPVIVTLRTKTQGGKKELSVSEYNAALRKIISEIKPAYIDIELVGSGSDANVRMLAVMAKKRGIGVIVSYHDLSFTEEARDIELLLCRMKYIGADIPKVAFTPNSEEDVEKLIRGASLAHDKIGDLIAISMGELGQKTRKEGDSIGSCINFVKPVGSGYDENSNTGQMEIE